MNKKIKKVMRDLNISISKGHYTSKELLDISKLANCSLYDVMYFLRFGKYESKEEDL